MVTARLLVVMPRASVNRVRWRYWRDSRLTRRGGTSGSGADLEILGKGGDVSVGSAWATLPSSPVMLRPRIGQWRRGPLLAQTPENELTQPCGPKERRSPANPHLYVVSGRPLSSVAVAGTTLGDWRSRVQIPAPPTEDRSRFRKFACSTAVAHLAATTRRCAASRKHLRCEDSRIRAGTRVESPRLS